MDIDTQEASCYDLLDGCSEYMKTLDYTAGDNVANAAYSAGNNYMVIGTRTGGILVLDVDTCKFMDHGNEHIIMNGQIGHVSVKGSQICLASSTGTVLRYQIVKGNILPPDDDPSAFFHEKLNEPITALCMDEKAEEGMVATAHGNIFYVNFGEKVSIKLVTRVSTGIEKVNICKYDMENPSVFLCNAGVNSGDLHLFTSQHMDQISKFNEYSLGPIAFVIGSTGRTRRRLLGHTRGILRFVNIESLSPTAMFQIALEEGETLTCGTYFSNNTNFAVGTSLGKVYLCSFKLDYRKVSQVKCALLTNLLKRSEAAVTCIIASSFDPAGWLVVAFDNAKVCVWNSNTNKDDYDKVKAIFEKKKDIEELGAMQFDLKDKFDMFLDLATADKEEVLSETDKLSTSKTNSPVSLNCALICAGREVPRVRGDVRAQRLSQGGHVLQLRERAANHVHAQLQPQVDHEED